MHSIFDYATTLAEENIAWYGRKKRQKQIGAIALRVVAILAGICAGLIPILSQITAASGPTAIQPGWASIALLIAAGAIALDRFYGFSSAWIRFVSTGLQLRSALHDFHLAWQIRLASSSGNLQAEDIAAGLAACRGFVAEIDKLVQKETAEWMGEFKTVLKDIEAPAHQHDPARAAVPGKSK
jgi:hypothetical protein